MDNERLEELRCQVRDGVNAGYDDDEQILELAVDAMLDDEPPPTEEEAHAIAEQLLREARAAHASDEASWGAEATDNDRLAVAFAALERARIVARENFTCCMTCGHAEINDELESDSIGYTFFHMQDSERAAQGEGLMLAYGGLDEGSAVAVAHQVVAALREAGLSPAWSGKAAERIHVPITWRRRTAAS